MYTHVTETCTGCLITIARSAVITEISLLCFSKLLLVFHKNISSKAGLGRNKCSDRRMEVKFPALFQPTNRRAERQYHREVSLPMNYARNTNLPYHLQENRTIYNSRNLFQMPILEFRSNVLLVGYPSRNDCRLLPAQLCRPIDFLPN